MEILWCALSFKTADLVDLRHQRDEVEIEPRPLGRPAGMGTEDREMERFWLLPRLP